MLQKTSGATTAVAPDSKTFRVHSGNGLRTPYLLARSPIIGLIMMLIGVSLFGVLAINLETHGPLLQTDTQIVNEFHEAELQSSTLERDTMGAGYYLGEHIILAIGALLGIYFLFNRYWTELMMVVVAWLGEGAIWLSLSHYFNRPRPTFALYIWTQAPGPSFPSGHTLSAVMCYGLLAYLLVPKIRLNLWKVFVVLIATLIIIFVGVSRVYTGDHFPTDVLAGYALGVAWTGLAYTAVELISRMIVRHRGPARSSLDT